MQKLLTASLVLASLLSPLAAAADDDCQAAAGVQQEPTATAPEPTVISWDRVGGKEKWWA